MRKKKLIKLIIEIDEKYYEACKDAIKDSYPSQIEEVIANGTPLPKEHGDLISRSELKKKIEFYKSGHNVGTDYENGIIDGYEFCLDEIDNAPTVSPEKALTDKPKD